MPHRVHHGLDDSRMRRLLGYCVALAAAPTRKVYDREIGEPLALRRIEFTILVLVDANPATTQKALARALRVSVPYLTVTLDRMRERGLLERVRSHADRRQQLIHLTSGGRDLLRRAETIAATMEEPMLSSLTAAERLMLFELLDKLAASHP
jgi:DNA-binding MarR family transcriptional regulator